MRACWIRVFHSGGRPEVKQSPWTCIKMETKIAYSRQILEFLILTDIVAYLLGLNLFHLAVDHSSIIDKGGYILANPLSFAIWDVFFEMLTVFVAIVVLFDR